MTQLDMNLEKKIEKPFKIDFSRLPDSAKTFVAAVEILEFFRLKNPEITLGQCVDELDMTITGRTTSYMADSDCPDSLLNGIGKLIEIKQLIESTFYEG